MLYAFKVYYAQNYAGIIRQGLTTHTHTLLAYCDVMRDYS